MKENGTLTEQICKKILIIQDQEFDEKVLDQARACILDFIGVCVAGSKYFIEQNEIYLSEYLALEQKYSIIGTEYKTDPYTAVLVNGWNGHALELDDGHRFGMMHLGTVICPPVLALYENRKISGEELLRGIIAGYEVAVSLSVLMQPSHKQRGYHTTGTCGSVGAAAAVATSMKYREEEIRTTLSAAATSAGGLLEIQEDSSEMKAYNAGQAALNGYVAGKIGRCGWLGPDDILGGARGMMRVMSDWTNQSVDCANHFYIESIYRKPYASCRHSHSAIEAALYLKEKYDFCIDQIKNIEVQTYKAGILGHDHKKIFGTGSAKMSTPYAVAVSLLFGKAGLAEFTDEIITNENLVRLISLIDMRENEKLSMAAPQKRSAIVKITLQNGESYMKQVDFPKGEPENPMTKEELEIKFVELCRFANMKEETINAIRNHIWQL